MEPPRLRSEGFTGCIERQAAEQEIRSRTLLISAQVVLGYNITLDIGRLGIRIPLLSRPLAPTLRRLGLPLGPQLR